MNFVQNNVCPKAISIQEIRDKTKNDINSQKVISKMQNKKEEINIENKDYIKLTLTPNGILLKQNRIMISNELQHRLIELAFRINHLGIAKTIALLREKNYFVKGATKLYFTHYSCVGVILFNTV